MKSELHNYDIFPKAFIVGELVDVIIRPLGAHVAFVGDYTISVRTVGQGTSGSYPKRNNKYACEVSTDEKGELHFTHRFSEEGEYLIRILRGQERIAVLSVYALEEDMRGRYPFIGDLHMHTCRSDGKQSPAIVAANYRRYGYDFMAITDHERYYPSLEAIDAYKNVPHDLNIVYGEEVQLPGYDMHIVNFGGKYSVSGIVDSSAQHKESDCRAVIDNPPPVMTEEQYFNEVNALIPQLNIPEEIEAFPYAACVWACEQIRKAEGLSIFAHPYWLIQNACNYDCYHIPESLCEYITEQHPYDAFEVLGGANYFQHNGFQTLRYYEDKAKGVDYPIVGSTDSHNSIREENPDVVLSTTFVFSKENEREALISAIKDKYSVAIDRISPQYRLVGDFRLVKYARFLMDEYLPLHDELCYEEGRLMKAYATGDVSAAEGLKFVCGRVKRLQEKYFKI